MKRLFALLLAGTMILTACTVTENKGDGTGNGIENGNGNKPPVETPAEVPTYVTPDPATLIRQTKVDEFKLFLEEVDSPFDVKHRSWVSEFRLEKTADVLVSEYIRFLRAYLFMGLEDKMDSIQELEPYFDDETGTINSAAITDLDLKTLYKEMDFSGYKFIAIEGSIMPIINYHFMDRVAIWISTEMQDYMKFMALDSDKIWASDGGLRIDPKELGDRIAEAEKFMTKYPDSMQKGDVLNVYRNYLWVFLGGLDNTPVVVDRKYSESFTSAYVYFLEQYPESATAKVIRPYFEELKARDFVAPYDEFDRESTLAFSRRVDSIVEEAAWTYGLRTSYAEYAMTTENLPIRSGPDLSTIVLITVPKGTVVREFFSWKGWARIETSGWTGYSQKEYLDSVTLDLDEYRMTEEPVNLRETPDLASKVLTVIPSGTMVRIEADEVDWGKTTYAGFTGYIAPANLKLP